MAIKGYNPLGSTISFMGLSFIPNGEDVFIRITRESDEFSDVVGTRGQTVRVKSNDNRATVELTLLHTDEQNLLLSTIGNADRLSDLGAGVGPFYFTEGNNTYLSAQSWIQRSPDVERGLVPGAQVWTIRLASFIRVDGGSSDI